MPIQPSSFRDRWSSLRHPARSHLTTTPSGGRSLPAPTGAIPRELTATSGDVNGTPSPTCRTSTPRPTPRGPARNSRPRPSGSLPPAADSIARPTCGAITTLRAGGPVATCGRASSPGRTCSRTVTSAPLRSESSGPTATDCSTWPGTCGNGRPITTRPTTPTVPRTSRRPRRAAFLVIPERSSPRRRWRANPTHDG